MNTIRSIPGLVCAGLVCFFYMFFYIYVFSNYFQLISFFSSLLTISEFYKIRSTNIRVCFSTFACSSQNTQTFTKCSRWEILTWNHYPKNTKWMRSQHDYSLFTTLHMTILASRLFTWLSSPHDNCSSQKLLYNIDVLRLMFQHVEYLNLVKWWVDLASSICYVSISK